MKPITQLTREDIENIKLVCFDVDGVTIKRGTDIKEVKTKQTTTLTVKTSNLSPRMLKKMLELKKYFFIAIASGRSSLYLTKIYSELLWDRAALISEIGIFTLIDGQLIQHEKFDKRTLKIMRNIFVDLKKLEGKHKDFRAFEPKQFLITLHAWNEIPEVYDIVKKHDLNNEFYCWWNGEAFDIAPKRLNKGAGIKHLADYLKINMGQTMAIGNGPNDADMVKAAEIGITTDPKVLPADFYTTGSLHLGGEELVDRLLELVK
jgi:HAD superfamily hydrolase (TIGR01484 family)